MPHRTILWLALLWLCGVLTSPLHAQQSAGDLRGQALRTLKKAALFYRNHVATHGGYAYYYSGDLRQRWGEGMVSADTILVQPPGTPTVGQAYLEAYGATDDSFYLDAARQAAEALVYGQLESGGWTQTIHFGPAERRGKYRNGNGGRRNSSSLDDGQTQSALQMLMRTDRELEFKHPEIHDAALYGLAALLDAQFPNGAFPQVWTAPVRPQPVLTARFPVGDWRAQVRTKNYWDYYTLNDNLAGSVAETLIVAHQTYKDPRYKSALAKLGDFLILAQMPDPQPAWCQQYDYQMVPMWARKFEPPGIASSESQDAMETLIKIARYTGEARYLEPIPRALRYLESCRLPGGMFARFYELGTNRPLYMDADYQPSYDDSSAPSHYSWKRPARLEKIARAYQAAQDGRDPSSGRRRSAAELEAEAREIVEALDEHGRWISTYDSERLVGQPEFEPSFQYISSDVFSHNMQVLSAYIGNRE